MTSDWPQILHAVRNWQLICAYQISSNSERKKISGLVWFVLLIKVDLPIPLILSVSMRYHDGIPSR